MGAEGEQSKAGHNQALFREVNERIRDISHGLTTDEETGFLCECANTKCLEMMSMTLDEYEAVRRMPTRFPVKPGHEVPEAEVVVVRTDRFYVVEKIGKAGEVAVREWFNSDPPRGAAS